MHILEEKINTLYEELKEQKFPLYLDIAFFHEEYYVESLSHKDAALRAIDWLNAQEGHKKTKYTLIQDRYYLTYLDWDFSTLYIQDDKPYSVSTDLMHALPIPPERFFSFSSPEDATRYQRFFFHPLGPFNHRHDEKLFSAFNHRLFPNQETLTIYRWNTTWSNYFTTGDYFLGSMMYTIYDPKNKQMTVIASSEHD